MDALELITSSARPSTKTASSMAGDAGLDLLKQAVAPSTAASRGDAVGDFVQQYQPVAERIGRQLGVAPESLLGQWGLETGWGKSVIPGTNNLGNIKDFTGTGTKAKDNMTGSVDAYRTYGSADEFADDFAGLVGRRYQSAVGSGQDAQRFFSALKANGYAEDPEYVAKGTKAAQMAAAAMGKGNTQEKMPLLALTAGEAKKVDGERSTAQAAKDVGIGFAAGVTGGVGALASVFGADNAVARTMDDASKDLMDAQSPQRKAERAQRQQKIQDAEASGSSWEEIKAYAGSMGDAPVETIVGAIGSSAPTLLAALIPGGQAGAAMWIARGAQLVMGAAQGTGAVKSSIYEAVENRLIKEGVDADTAAKTAAGAQAYDSANAGQIAAGAVLGAAAGVLGAEAALGKVVNKVSGPAGSRIGNAAASALAEAPTEALQGGQERYAANTALIDQGFTDVSPMTGVAGSATLEGLAGAGVGGAMGVLQQPQQQAATPKPGDALRHAANQEDSPLAKAMVAAGADQQMDADAQAQADAAQAQAAQTPEVDPEAQYAQQLDERAQQLRTLLQDRSVMDQLREAAGMRMTDVMGEIATATSSRAKPEVREQAMTRIDMALSWAGIGPNAKPQATQPTDTPALAHDDVLQVDSQGRVMGVNERQAQREAQVNAEPFTDVTPVAPGPYTPPAATPQLTDSSQTIAVDGAGNAATAEQRTEFLQQQERAFKEPFRDVTPVPAAPDAAPAQPDAPTDTSAAGLPAPDTRVTVDASGVATTMEQRQAQTNAQRAPFRDVTPVAGAKSAMPVAPVGREATAIRQRREDLMQHARNGMTTVERRGDRFAMVNPATKQEYLLGSTADAVLARKAVADAINAQAGLANTNPSDKQKISGNYKKGRVSFEGLKIAIENPIGSTRSGTDPNGERWETPMEFAHYGDLEGTKGADGDPIDVYLAGDARGNQPAYVVDQYNLDGTFDEHKVVMGAFSQAEALRIYDAGFTDGTGPQRRGAVTAMAMPQLKAWAKSGKTQQPAGARKPKPAPVKTRMEELADAAGAKLIGTHKMGGLTLGLVDRLPDTGAKLGDGLQSNTLAAQQALEKLGSMFGKRVQFFVAEGADGFAVPTHPSTIYLNARSEIDVRAVFGHELMHLLKADHPQVHAALTAEVLARVPDKDGALQQYIDLGYPADQAMEELLSDVGGDFMREQAFWDDVIERLYDAHPMAAARKFLKKFLDALTGLWGKLTDGPAYADASSGGFGQALMDGPEQVRDAFVQAIANYAKDSGLKDLLTPPAQPNGTQASSAANLQNRDRSRAASVAQMQSIANAPDYGRLGISRTPDSGAPMVFAVGDKAPAGTATGKQDVAVMSDGQRVPFTYAVMEAAQLQPSHAADGSANPDFSSSTEGTVKALNNGRTAGIKAAYDSDKAGTYRKELAGDAAAHGVNAAAIEAMQAPVLVRLYAEKDNTEGMAERSQAQSMGLSAAEQAVQDGKLLDTSVLAVFEPGDVTSSGNLDFARAFVGKLQAAGQDVSGMMQANGALSTDGANRLRAALVQAAYGDADLVAQLFDSTTNDIQAIGNALRDVAGEWANMRDSANAGAINPEADATEHLLAALRMVQKQRRDGVALADQSTQVDLESGSAPHPLAVGMLRVLYDGENFTKARSRDAMTDMLRTYVAAANQTRADGGLLGDVLGAQQIIESLTQGTLANAITPTPTADSRAAGSNTVSPAPADAQQSNAADSQATGAARDGQRGQPADAAQGQPAGDSLLATYTPQEVTARQDATDNEAQAQAAAVAQAEREEKARKDAADIAARQDASAENFELGQDPMDALAGQGSIFDSPEQGAVESMALNIAAGNLNASADAERNSDLALMDQGLDAIDSDFAKAFVADAQRHAKREAAKARGKARDARAQGNEELAQRYEATADTYAAVDWEDFARAVQETPDVFFDSDIDPVLVYSNLPKEGFDADWDADQDINQSKPRTTPSQGVRLRAIHNLSADNLRFSDEMGGIAVPSIGVVTAEKGGVNGFGEITLVGTKDLADPKREPVFTSDAYTVRFPEPVWDAAPWKKAEPLYNAAKALDAELDGTLAHYVWDYINEHPDAKRLAEKLVHSDAGKVMFLREQGIAFKPKMKKQEVPFSLTLAQFKKHIPLLKEVSNHRYSEDSALPDSPLQKARELILKPHLDKMRAKFTEQGRRDVMANRLLLSIEESFERDVEQALRTWQKNEFAPVVDSLALHEQLKKALAKLQPQLLDWAHKKSHDLFPPPRLELGRRKVPFTLDNIVSAMTSARDARGQEKTMVYGPGQVRAAASHDLRNLEQMRDLADQSIANPDEYELAKERSEKLLTEYRHAVGEYTTLTNWRGDKNLLDAYDEAMKALAKWARGPRTTASLAAALRTDFRGVPEHVLQMGVDAGNALLAAPVPYFEAKPQRAVAINEFAGAVIPKKASQETRDLLAKHGIPMVEYDKNDPAARRAALDKLTKRLAKDRDDVLFSRRRVLEQPLPDAEITTNLADAVANAPARLGRMAPAAWASWLRTQARAGRMDGAKLQQLEIAETLASHPKAALTAQDVAAMVRDAEHELQQLQALVDDHAGTMAQNLRNQGVFAQLCD